MTKEQYIQKSFVEIRAKNLKAPFELVSGQKVTDLEKYLSSLETAYLNNKGSVEKLFYDKIEFIRKL